MRLIRNVIALLLLVLTLWIIAIVFLGNYGEVCSDASRDQSCSDVADTQLAPTVTLFERNIEFTQGVVEHVSDGDTVRIRIGSQVETVRLIGIDAPELGRDSPSDCRAEDARDYLTRLVDGKTVYLEGDVNDVDRYGRMLRYLWLPRDDGYLMVNQMIVSRGYAAARIYFQDDLHAVELARSELDAIKNDIGIWGECVTSEQHGIPGAPESWDGRIDLDCADFASRVNAQAFHSAMGGPDQDPHNLDVDRNGLVCHTRPPTDPLE